ncbi:MAG: hypothetical protein GXO88_03415 [Chlorobi bacterium]|nr:hypothetical protein [Chlorobiota bacterium]
MKNYINPEAAILIVMLLLSATYATAKKDPPPMKFGELTASDFVFDINDHPEFDKNAEAVILCDYGQEFSGVYGSFFQTRTVMHRRMLILNKKGLSQANVEYGFHSVKKSNSSDMLENMSGKYGSFWVTGKGSGVFRIKASSYFLEEDGSITKLDLQKEDIHLLDASELIKNNKIVFSIPAVKVGSIIEYTITEVGEFSLLAIKWYFQHKLPCLHSEFRFAYNETDSYAIITTGLMEMDMKPVESSITSQQFIKYKTKTNKFILEDIPGMKWQPFISSMDNYRAGLMLQLNRYYDKRRGKYKTIISTWEELAEKYTKDPAYGKQLFRSSAQFEEIKNRLPDVNTTDEKIEICFNYVKNKFNWNGFYKRIPERKLNQLINETEASSAEINLFLTRLLREFGINAKAAFASTRGHGLVNPNYPFIGQFNTTVCYIQYQGVDYVLDASNKNQYYRNNPINLIGTKIFPVDMVNPRLVKVSEKRPSSQTIVVNSEIIDGQLVNNVNLKLNGYFALMARNGFTANDNSFIDYYFEVDNTDFEISDLKLFNYSDLNKSFLASFNCKPVNAIIKLDSLLLIEPSSLFQEINKNPFISGSRSFPVEFNYSFKQTFRYNIIIPEGYEIAGIPENRRYIMSDNTAAVDAIYQYSNGNLQIIFVLQSANLIYQPDKYPELKNLFKNWEDLNNISIAIKKI